MAYSIDDYNNLLEAYKTGALKVRHGDKETTFRSQSEMRRLLDAMARDLRRDSGRSPIGPKWTPGLGSS